MQLTTKEGVRLALEMYGRGRPVVLVTEGQEHLVHGQEDVKVIIGGINCPQNVSVYELPVSLNEWKASNWPEIFEAARRLWLRGELPEETKVQEDGMVD